MKKIITTALITTIFLASNVSAMESNLLVEPTLYTDEVEQEFIYSTEVQDLMKKYEIILRNNILESDYEYNSKTYYTSKLKTEDLIVPEEIKQRATKIYFLVEEGNYSVYFKNSAMMDEGLGGGNEVKKEYNYRVVDFKEGQEEYTFENKDLIKDFGEGEYSNVIITLMAEFSDTETMSLSNSAYVSIQTKEDILNRLKNEQEEKYSYYGYYDSSDLEEYLEELSEGLTRAKYKKMLEKADAKIEKALDDNELVKDDILGSITKESDFEKYIGDYAIYSETDNLLRVLLTAVNNQLQNIRAFDAIDLIFR